MDTIVYNFGMTVNSPKKLLLSMSVDKLTLTSGKFCNPKVPTVEFQLCVELLKSSNKVNIWIQQIGPISLNSLSKTKYGIWVIKDEACVDIAKYTYYFENQERLGFRSILLDKEIISSDGNLRLICKVEIDCYNSHDKLQNTYIDMFNEEILTDFVIKVGDEVIKTHKCILARNSKVFHRMFEQNGMTEAQNGEVIISDATPECVRAMLEFFYSGMVSDDKMKIHVYDIFAIAHKYQVEMLKYLCERFMSRNIDDKNIIKCCGIIDLYGTTTLEKACVNYIQANRRNFLKSKEWKKIKNNYSSLVPRFLEPIIERLNK